MNEKDEHTIISGSSSTSNFEVVIPDLENLRSYSQAKLSLGDLFRSVRQGMVILGRQDAERQIGELMVKLAEDRFTLAVLGQFKRGKSSLMNAIIGREILPTGVLPLTSAITILKFGPRERLIINKEHSLYPSEFPVTDLADYVTEKGNPHNEKKVKTAYLELPVPFLRYGIEFVDTPGVGSAIAANTETTYNFLPECDAALFVTSVDTPMTNTELGFLRQIKEYVNKIFFVINKIDLVNDKEKKEISEFVIETIKSEINVEALKVFSVSCQLGLSARASGNQTQYEQSGLKSLEDSLALFLTEEKSETLLSAVVQRGLRIIDNETSQNILIEEYLQSRSAEIAKEKVRSIHGDPHDAALTIMKATERLRSFLKSILNEQTPVNSEIQEDAKKETSPIKIIQAISTKSVDEINLQADLRIRGCPVCEHLTDQAFDFFAHWQYQLSTNQQAQEEFAEEMAFCPLHTWQLLSISSPLGASVGYARLAHEVSHRLKRNFSQENSSTIRQWIHNSHNCSACQFLREVEEKYIKQMIASITNADGQNLYRHSDGTCFYHLSLLIDASPSPKLTDFLLHHAIEKFEQDAEDMQSYALKNDALRRSLQNDNEKDAYRRTIIRIVGEQSVCMPWAQDGII